MRIGRHSLSTSRTIASAPRAAEFPPRRTATRFFALALAAASVLPPAHLFTPSTAQGGAVATERTTSVNATEAVVAAGPVETNVDLPRYPSISPDGSRIAFTWRGDLFTVPTAGGVATRLTTNPSDDLYSAFSPDGTRLAFTSQRAGGSNVFTISLDGTGLKQVTYTDRPLTLTQWTTTSGGKEKLLLSGILEPSPFSAAYSYEVSPEGGDIDRLIPASGWGPVVSPDGNKVLFQRGAPGSTQWVRRGYRGADARDLWMYDRATKQYTRLTTFEGQDGKARWLDNETVIFLSNRPHTPSAGDEAPKRGPGKGGTYNLFTLKLGAPESSARALTRFDSDNVEDFDVALDAGGTGAGGTIVFSRWNRLYTLDPRSAQSTPIAIRAGEEETDRVRYQDIRSSVSEATLSPDGKAMAFVAYGEVYVRGTEQRSPTRRVSTGLGGRKRDVSWSADGDRLLFVCDTTGREEIYQATVRQTRSEVRRKIIGDPASTTRPSAAPASPSTEPGSTPPPATPPEGFDAQPPLDGSVGHLAASAMEPDQLRRTLPPGVTLPGGAGAGGAGGAGATPSTEPSKWGDAVSFDFKKLFDSPSYDRAPTPTPDGRGLAFVRGGNKLILRDEITGRERTVIEHFADFSFRLSPDGRYVAYAAPDRNDNSDVWIVPTDGSEKPVNISRHPNNDFGPRWSADGKILTFISDRLGNNDENTGYAVYLDKELESYATPELDAYFRNATTAARRRTPPATRPALTTRPAFGTTRATAATGSPTTRATASTAPTAQAVDPSATFPLAGTPGTQPGAGFGRRGGATSRPALARADLEDAYLRLRRITSVRGGIQALEISPAGDRFYFIATVGSQRGIYSQTRESPEPTRIADAGSIQELSLTGDSMTVLISPAAPTPGGGAAERPAGPVSARPAIVRLPSGDTEFVEPSDRLKVDLGKLSEQKFLEASRIMAENFYAPDLNGVDWKAVTAKYLPLATAARTSDEFDYVGNRFLGELNASHMGMNSPAGGAGGGGGGGGGEGRALPVGKLGVEVTRVAAAGKSPAGLRIDSVLTDGPADRGAMKLKTGDLITAIDAEPIGPLDTLDKVLAGKLGAETIVTVVRDGTPLDLLLTPTSFEALSSIAYNNWRLATLEKVRKLSDGKLGYIHVQGMSQPSLEVYKRDLYAACDGKKGMIVDVRWNGGGSTADLMLASFMSPYHAYTVPRGAPVATDSYPNDRLFIPRFVGPINMLCNERSFSNAEIISHAFKTLKRGTLVGNQTAGGVISTGGTSLLDGTSLRLPGRGWYTPDGTDMELNGALPDILVVQTPEDEEKEDDRQLKAAVEDLLKRVK